MHVSHKGNENIKTKHNNNNKKDENKVFFLSFHLEVA